MYMNYSPKQFGLLLFFSVMQLPVVLYVVYHCIPTLPMVCLIIFLGGGHKIVSMHVSILWYSIAIVIILWGSSIVEFIHLLASEASDISERQQKKVISPEHVVEALTTLGFQEYVPDVKAVHKEYKEQASVSYYMYVLLYVYNILFII